MNRINALKDGSMLSPMWYLYDIQREQAQQERERLTEETLQLR